MISKVKTLSRARVEEINAFLRQTQRVESDDPLTDLLDCISVKFPDGWIADIRVLNSDKGPYLDPILWDDHGNERVCLDEVDYKELTPNRFVFDGDDFEAHEVVVLKGSK